jgi:hypothetical protein
VGSTKVCQLLQTFFLLLFLVLIFKKRDIRVLVVPTLIALRVQEMDATVLTVLL